jgi:SulP family sulfate permease
MSFLRSELAQWRAHPLRELLAGAVATFALIPEVIAFSFVAGVDPQVGLFASFVLSIVIAVFGGRPAMITAAAGSVALVAAPLVSAHGLPYLFAAGLLAGAVQVLFGALRLDVLMRFVSSSVRTGFVNALAILIFAAQLPHLEAANAATWALLGLGLAIIYGLPYLPLPGLRVIPSPLICIVVPAGGAAATAGEHGGRSGPAAGRLAAVAGTARGAGGSADAADHRDAGVGDRDGGTAGVVDDRARGGRIDRHPEPETP